MLPYQNLYIYEISGEVTGSRTFFRDDYVGCWNEGEISFLFFSTPHDDEVDIYIKEKGMSLLSRNIFDYKDWQAGEELKPFKIENLLFCPPWENCVTGKGEILIHLDPCVVFGTGYHFTTRSCLKALWTIYQNDRPKTVLDLGTGSGILALAAAKWGAERILAIDCNELAADTALRNVRSNGESQKIEVRKGKAEEFIGEDADLLCANIHFQVMDALLGHQGFYSKKWFVLSGLFVKDAEEVERRLNLNSVKTYQKFQERNWLTLVGLRERKG